MSPLLEIQNLRAGYGVIEVLKGITIHVNPGEIVTIIGANGAGKTTTLSCISGIVRTRQGAIRFCPEPESLKRVINRLNRKNMLERCFNLFSRLLSRLADVPFLNMLIPNDEQLEVIEPDAAGYCNLSRISAHRIVDLGLAQSPEGRKIFPRLTVLENLQMGAFTRTDAAGIKEDIEKAYHYFPILKDRQKQLGGTLSGGEQQMLAIARALMARPKLLLLDEPSLGLAPMIVVKIFDVIRELNQTQGVAVLLVEQNARMALKLAHRGYVMETGAITMQDSAQALLNDPRVQAAYLGE